MTIPETVEYPNSRNTGIVFLNRFDVQGTLENNLQSL
jgi:hypothetical protein